MIGRLCVGFIKMKQIVHDSYRSRRVLVADYATYSDLRSRDHLDVDALAAERRKHSRGDIRLVHQTSPDHANLGDVLIGQHSLRASSSGRGAG